VPPLADCFSARPETGPGPVGELVPGRFAVLTTPDPPGSLHDWPGGTGKTQLAAFAAESLWRARQIELLVWVTATSRASVLAGYAQAFAETVGTDPAGDAETAASRFLAWLGQTSQPWLVVLDDVADAADLDGLWPEGPAGRVLITTPDASAPAGIADPLVFPVGVFSSHEALTYLMGRLSADPDQRVGAVDLLEDLGRDPIGLAQASAAITSSGITCRDYRDLFARRREQIAEALGALPSAKAVTWTLSVEQADQLASGRMAQSCLALAVLLDGHGIPGAVFSTSAACEYIVASQAGAPDPRHARGALLSLERAGLLTIDPASTARTVRVPSVVQAAVRSATPPSMRDQAARAAAGALLEAWPAQDGQLLLADALGSCVMSLHEAAADSLWAGGCHAILFQAGRSLDSAGLAGPAVAHWQALASATERILGAGHPDTLLASERLASASVAAGLGTAAVTLYQQTLDARAGALGSDHPSAVAARADLGVALLAAGRPVDAIANLEVVLTACERGLAPDDLDSLAVQDSLTAAYQAAGRYPEAIRLARRTLAERERQQGADHPATLTTRGNLAATCLAAGRLKDAIALGQRTLAGRERVLGADHLDTVDSLGTLATAYHSARRLKDAIPLFERALRDRERIQGADHPDTIGARGNLASAYHSAGRMASAMDLYERTRADCQRVLGAQHPDTLAARANLAHAYYAMGRQPEAVRLLQDTLADCERVLAPSDPLTVAVRESLDAVAQG
jgi:tetratricopeptide (TPR) repeat protein